MSSLYALIATSLVTGFVFWPALAILAVIVFVFWLAYSIGHDVGYVKGRRSGWSECVAFSKLPRRAGGGA